MAQVRLKPPPGQQYRIPATRQLADPEGQAFDDTDLDTVRAVACGDLVPADEPAAARGKTSKE